MGKIMKPFRHILYIISFPLSSRFWKPRKITKEHWQLHILNPDQNLGYLHSVQNKSINYYNVYSYDANLIGWIGCNMVPYQVLATTNMQYFTRSIWIHTVSFGTLSLVMLLILTCTTALRSKTIALSHLHQMKWKFRNESCSQRFITYNIIEKTVLLFSHCFVQKYSQAYWTITEYHPAQMKFRHTGNDLYNLYNYY